MLIIRDVQLQALRRPPRVPAATLCREHLRAHFGERLGGVDDGALARFVERATREAGGYDLTELRDLLLFLNLSVVYGEGFLAHPALRWVRAALLDASVGAPSERMRQAYDEVLRRADAAEGPATK
ncbi:MAG: hypothetical protein JWM10_5165 [Myxococcaceae bacterium]|nr:hypothetical protein [Myxococcaceae bacterium]